MGRQKKEVLRSFENHEIVNEYQVPIRPYPGYCVLMLDADDNIYKATLLGGDRNRRKGLLSTNTRVLYDHNKVIYDFHVIGAGNVRTNYVVISIDGVLASFNSPADEEKFRLGDQ